MSRLSYRPGSVGVRFGQAVMATLADSDSSSSLGSAVCDIKLVVGDEIVTCKDRKVARWLVASSQQQS